MSDSSLARAMYLPALMAGAALAGAAPACAAPATVSGPARLSLSAPASAAGDAYVEIAVNAFRPASDGAVQFVVDGKCGGAVTEIGRFGVFPGRAFGPGDPGRVQRFSLPVPAGLRCAGLDAVTVRLVPTLGRGAGASAEVEGRLVRHD